MNPIVANSHFYSFERKKKATKALKKWRRETKWKSKSPNLFDHHAISIQKYVEFSNPVYFMVIDKNRSAMLPEKYIFSYAIFEKNISHKSFEKVEKRGKMEIKESSKLI